MVSFSCEGCGDVLTKKKLDSHRGHCRDASFTCLDCMVNFYGTDYRSHTSCISEAQKYEGKLYKEKKKKTVTITLPGELDRQPYVEEVADEPNSALAIVDAPPPVPSPPPSAAQPVNVFDFLVNEGTPTTTKFVDDGQQEQMRMIKDAPPIFKSLSSSPDERSDGFPDHFTSNGYAYGAEPVPTYSYETPAAKTIGYQRPRHQHTSSTDKKRKRQVEELDLSRASRSSQELDDEDMEDVSDGGANGAPVLHSGLTGGLNRLLSQTSNFPPSPDYSGADGPAEPSPLSPGKRKRSVASVASALISGDKVRGRRRHAAGTGQLIKVRKVRRSSDESRPRKHRRSHGSPNGQERDSRDAQQGDDRRRRRSSAGTTLKAIEYQPAMQRSVSPNADNQVVVYRSRAELFLSMVEKGPESEHGYSMNKALKRYHRERLTSGTSRLEKNDEEKELWRSLRLKRNERGEVVVFMGDGAPLQLD